MIPAEAISTNQASTPLKAIIIDDCYARPSASDFRKHTDTFRQFITDNPEAGIQVWLTREFDLSGDHKQGDYFDSLLAEESRVLSFWNKRDESPVGERLSHEVFAELVEDLRPAHKSLENIETYLSHATWNVQTFASLPNADDLADDISVIVIDYILIPDEGAENLRRSTEFLSSYLRRIKAIQGSLCPFVLLMSENADNERDAVNFRETVKVHGAYFRFAKKIDLTEEAFSHIVKGFQNQREELESYRLFHDELCSAAEAAGKELQQRILGLELQDLATLHAGQLVQEGELLSDYLAGLFGKYLTAEMLQQAELASRAASLPLKSYKVLLGHLEATQNIPALFAAVSFVMSASGKQYKAKHGKLQLRFGDLFVRDIQRSVDAGEVRLPEGAQVVPVPEGFSPVSGNMFEPGAAAPQEPQSSPGSVEVVSPANGVPAVPTPRYLMVISQTCDLYHRNIKNGQVLCIDGEATEIESTEVGLLRATAVQMDSQGTVLLWSGTKLVQVGWRSKDLRTIDERSLCAEEGYHYLGQLNEMYALQAQHSAVQELGRIGVPIQPSYSMLFGKVTLTVWDGPREKTKHHVSLDCGVVLAVLRNEKYQKSIHRLLISEALRQWLVVKFTLLETELDDASQLKTPLGHFRTSLDKGVNVSLICQIENGKKTSWFQGEVLLNVGARAGKPKERLAATIHIVLKNVFDTSSPTNQHIQIELEPINNQGAHE